RLFDRLGAVRVRPAVHLRSAVHARPRGVAARGGVAAAAVPRRRRGVAARTAVTVARVQCIAMAARGMMAPRWRITSLANRWAVAAATFGASPDSRAAR